jgi:hypothetical protein
MSETLKEHSLWTTLDAWNRLTVGWSVGLKGLTREQAKSRADDCSRFAAQYPSFPGLDDLEIYKRYVETIGNRGTGTERPATKLSRLLSDILVDNVYMVTVTSKEARGASTTKRYYATQKPTVNGAFVKFDSILSFDGKEITRTISGDRVTYNHLSPQSEIATRFKPIMLDEAKHADWERVMIELVTAILKQPDIEPILQIALLSKVVDVGSEGSESLRESFSPLKSRLDQAGVDVNVQWMDPETPRLERLRSDATRVIDSLVPMVPTMKAVAERRELVVRAVAETYHTVGWLTIARDEWQLQTEGVLPAEGDLWVVGISLANRGMWRKVGTLTGGKPSINTRDVSTLAEGRPVFLRARAVWSL